MLWCCGCGFVVVVGDIAYNDGDIDCGDGDEERESDCYCIDGDDVGGHGGDCDDDVDCSGGGDDDVDGDGGVDHDEESGDGKYDAVVQTA